MNRTIFLCFRGMEIGLAPLAQTLACFNARNGNRMLVNVAQSSDAVSVTSNAIIKRCSRQLGRLQQNIDEATLQITVSIAGRIMLKFAALLPLLQSS